MKNLCAGLTFSPSVAIPLSLPFPVWRPSQPRFYTLSPLEAGWEKPPLRLNSTSASSQAGARGGTQARLEAGEENARTLRTKSLAVV